MAWQGIKDYQALTIFWGEKHFELFKRACFKSIAQPKNARTLEHCTWNIFTDDKYFDRIRELVDKQIPAIKAINFLSSSDCRDRNDASQSALVWQIRRCLELDQQMLMAPPDTIFGDGSIENMLKVGSLKNECVAVAHPRVLPSILDEPFGDNPEFVSRCWKHLHKSWTDAETGHPRQNSFIGGVSWQRIGRNLYSICHRLPTIYVASFTKEDEKFFDLAPGVGHFDHIWPSLLVQQGRQRLVGSSDAAMIAEVTEADKNVPPVNLNGDPNEFWQKHPHNEHNKQMRVIFRGI